MSIFQDQKIYCTNCGTQFFGNPQAGVCCSIKCRDEIEAKQVCFILGKRHDPTDEEI